MIPQQKKGGFSPPVIFFGYQLMAAIARIISIFRSITRGRFLNRIPAAFIKRRPPPEVVGRD